MRDEKYTPFYVLNPQPAGSPTPENAPRCGIHLDAPATGTCERCGTFYCEQDVRHVLGKKYCSPCAARPDVNYLESFRLKYWGKRDTWAWLFGIGALANTAMAIGLIVAGQYLLAAFLAGAGLVGVFYFLGQPWTRYAVLALPLLNVVLGLATAHPEQAIASVLPFIISVGIFTDTRNKLFFKVEISEQALQKAWNLYANNQLARTGLILAVFSLIAFPAAPIALVLSIIGLRRVDPDAYPPIGKRVHAIAGIIISGGVTALMVLGLAMLWLKPAGFK